MRHLLSMEDRDFCSKVQSCKFPAAELNHRAHLKLAYIYLTENDTETAHHLMRDALRSFLNYNGIDPSKYHETMTRAWMLAVRHFMESSSDAESADLFIEQNPAMLDPEIMMTHYSAEVLFSDEARSKFIEPDLGSIPKHDV